MPYDVTTSWGVVKTGISSKKAAINLARRASLEGSGNKIFVINATTGQTIAVYKDERKIKNPSSSSVIKKLRKGIKGTIKLVKGRLIIKTAGRTPTSNPRRGRSFAGDMKRIVKRSRALQSKFLKSQGLTMAQARKLTKSEQEQLQRLYSQWYNSL